MSETPNPGSDAAIDAGCTCPVMDNAYGNGFLWDVAPVFWIAEGCPLHDKRNKRKDADDDRNS